jgi:hypothetical protein
MESKIANAKHPAIAMAQPMIFGMGNVSFSVNKYRDTKINTLFKVLPTAVGTAPKEPRT